MTQQEQIAWITDQLVAHISGDGSQNNMTDKALHHISMTARDIYDEYRDSPQGASHHLVQRLVGDGEWNALDDLVHDLFTPFFEFVQADFQQHDAAATTLLWIQHYDRSIYDDVLFFMDTSEYLILERVSKLLYDIHKSTITQRSWHAVLLKALYVATHQEMYDTVPVAWQEPKIVDTFLQHVNNTQWVGGVLDTLYDEMVPALQTHMEQQAS